MVKAQLKSYKTEAIHKDYVETSNQVTSAFRLPDITGPAARNAEENADKLTELVIMILGTSPADVDKPMLACGAGLVGQIIEDCNRMSVANERIKDLIDLLRSSL